MFRLLGNKLFWLILLVVIVSLVTMSQTTLPRENITVLEKAVHYIYTPLQNGIDGLGGHWGNLRDLFSDSIGSIMKTIDIIEGQRKNNYYNNKTNTKHTLQLSPSRGCLHFHSNPRLFPGVRRSLSI